VRHCGWRDRQQFAEFPGEFRALECEIDLAAGDRIEVGDAVTLSLEDGDGEQFALDIGQLRSTGGEFWDLEAAQNA
jgi:hypothetical protein